MAELEIFVRVIVCLALVSVVCAGKTRAAGVSVSGCKQAVVLFTARQMLPESAGLVMLPPPQAVE